MPKGHQAHKKHTSRGASAGSSKRDGEGTRGGRKGARRASSSDDEGALRAQLRDIGLRIEPMAGDGNCFFRALSDQRWGDDSHHLALRDDVVSYMRANRSDFEPFIEDDEKWDAYVSRMAEDGTWAGHVELQAASVACFSNLCVHQAGQPRWEIRNYPLSDRCFHVAYRDGDHYDSVRLLSEDGRDETRDGFERATGFPGGGPIVVAAVSSRATRPKKRFFEPSFDSVAATVAATRGVGKRSRARDLLRLFDGCVDSASLALRAEISHKGVLRGGAGDDPVPGVLRAAECAPGSENPDGDAGDGEAKSDARDDDGSEDDWEPVVHKKIVRGSRVGGGRRSGRRFEEDDLSERVVALRI